MSRAGPDTVKKITKALLGTGKKVGLEANAEKTKCIFMFCEKNAGQNYNIKTANTAFEHEAKFRCLETTLKNQNYMHEKMKSSLNLGNACYHSVQNLFFPLAI
jgi:hypothetical protein